MNTAINNVFSAIRTRLQEDAVAWGPDMSGMASTNHSGGKPGDGGATNETDIPDALDKYIGSIVDSLVAAGSTESAAYAKVMATARKPASDGTLPAMPSESADDAEIALWLGKAASIAFAQHVFQHGND